MTGAASEARETMGEVAAEQRENLGRVKESASVRARMLAGCCRVLGLRLPCLGGIAFFGAI